MPPKRSQFVPRAWVALTRPTWRFRLALLYGLLFLISGAVLLAITNVLVRHATAGFTSYDYLRGASVFVGPNSSQIEIGAHHRPHGPLQTHRVGKPNATPHEALAQAQQLKALAVSERANELHQFLIFSWVALGIMVILSVALGWAIAGRVLRPVRRISATARSISERNLSQRLTVAGPDDEFRDLGETLNDLLGRLEAAFESQRHFVANASHELRTPLTVEHTLLQVALADPCASGEELRSTCETLLANSIQQEHLIDALLTLATSERGLDRWRPFDLAAVVEEVVNMNRKVADRKSLQMDTDLRAAPASGDPHLAQVLVINLVTNAIRHNVVSGRVDIATRYEAGIATLSVSNSGPVIPAEDVERLLQPFQRRGDERLSDATAGHGLGLAIVQAIVTTHGADIDIRTRNAGGLDIVVRFPARAIQ